MIDVIYNKWYYSFSRYAGVAELADAPDLGSGGSSMGVRVPSRAPRKSKTLRLGEVFYLQLPI